MQEGTFLSEDHQLIRLIDEFIAVKDVEVDNLSPDSKFEINYFVSLFRYLRYALLNTDPALLPETVLSDFYRELNEYKIHSNISAFKSRKDIRYFISAIKYFASSNLLAKFHSIIGLANASKTLLPIIEVQKLIEGARNEIQDANDEFNQELLSLNEQATLLKHDLDTQKSYIIQVQSRIDDAINQFQKQYIALAEDTRKETQKSIQKAISDLELQFKARIEKDFDKVIEAKINGVTQSVDEARKTIGEQLVGYSSAIGSHAKDIAAKREEINKVFSLASGDSMASVYMQMAREEKNLAGWWSLGAVSAMLSACGALIWSYFNGGSLSIDDPVFLGKAIRVYE